MEEGWGQNSDLLCLWDCSQILGYNWDSPWQLPFPRPSSWASRPVTQNAPPTRQAWSRRRRVGPHQSGRGPVGLGRG